jgi:glyoxylate/hydroxypyruvate reductase
MTKKRLLLAGMEDYFETWRRAADSTAAGLDLVPYVPGQAFPGFPYLLIWRPVPELFASLPDLRVIFCLGAGTERLIADPSIPARLPLVRMVEPGLTQCMVDYVLWRVLYHHRRMWELEEAQAQARWAQHLYPAAWERKVGILGLGTLGQACAEKLAEFEFQVRGWSRSPKSVAKVACFAGTETLGEFLAGLDILVCLLPLTPETKGILNADLFARLAPRAALVNAGRGGHLVDDDLLAALADGRMGSATLDVFHREPLPPDHPFWLHPRVFVTPHYASETHPPSALVEIARQIERFEQGATLEHVVDRQRGY